MSKLNSLPKAVREAVGKFSLRWTWHDGGSRTVMGGYALYAKTGHHENGASIERRVYMTLEKERARSLVRLLKESDPDLSFLERQLEDVIFDRLCVNDHRF